ncbi:nickel pincer cofactor biosynthesis protein LarB [Planctomicrobium sp. SH661]|uniref:nickel pincer cofactor biosynthesis protein LarB n=1 Tax=Planctomicrobium sp. SH661 TaxID=3448124 RepID=UPI003F5C612C
MSRSIEDSHLRSLLQLLADGTHSVEHVHQQLASHVQVPPISSPTEVRIDLQREQRCGYPEVIYAPGKSVEALKTAFHALLQRGQSALATRCDPAQAAELCEAFPQARHHALARTVCVNLHPEKQGRVVVVTAGTSDRPVAEEAMETLSWMGIHAELLMDVGVAGPQRFLQEKHRLEKAQAIIVVAGMEGALPSVVAGWVACPVIAVPTSVGYGTAFGGMTALLGMLNSCAANVAVVNIDAGFKGAYLAGMIARQSLHPHAAG